MRRLLVGLVFAAACSGAYTYDYVLSSTTEFEDYYGNWHQNGSPSFVDNNYSSQIPGGWDYNVYTFWNFASNGSTALVSAISEPDPNDYEINSQLGLKSG